MEIGDAFGRLLLDHLEGRQVAEIVERDDGLMMTGGPPASYFAPFRRWDYLLATPTEMEELAVEAGWRLARTFAEPDPQISLYVGILEKD